MKIGSNPKIISKLRVLFFILLNNLILPWFESYWFFDFFFSIYYKFYSHFDSHKKYNHFYLKNAYILNLISNYSSALLSVEKKQRENARY